MLIRYSLAAERDLLWLASSAPDTKTAQRLLRKLRVSIAQSDACKEHSGAVEEWNGSDVLQFLVGDYRVIYQRNTNEIRVLTIVHRKYLTP
jgi:plasmid stabilization system protein ParE